MNTRKFIVSLGFALLAPWKSLLGARKPDPPLFTQVFPKSTDEFIGLFIGVPGQVYPYEVLREFDEWNDTWQGQSLHNEWRNKWWVKNVNGGEELALIDRMPIGEWGHHTWGFDPNILFFKRNT